MMGDAFTNGFIRLPKTPKLLIQHSQQYRILALREWLKTFNFILPVEYSRTVGEFLNLCLVWVLQTLINLKKYERQNAYLHHTDIGNLGLTIIICL